MLSLVFMFKQSPVLLNSLFSYFFGNAERAMNSFWNQLPVISLTWLNFCLFMSGLDVLLVFLFMWSHYFTHITLEDSLGLRKGVCSSRDMSVSQKALLDTCIWINISISIVKPILPHLIHGTLVSYLGGDYSSPNSLLVLALDAWNPFIILRCRPVIQLSWVTYSVGS